MLKPFFCYFGGKWRAAPRYPAPQYNRIIEPFAGAAGYSTRYHTNDIELYEIDPLIYGIWKYLIAVKPSEIMALPTDITHVDEIDGPQEAKWLVAFWLNKAAATPHKSASSWMLSGIRPNSHWGEAIRERIAKQIEHIRHWKIYNCSYTNAPPIAATWFIDPPYAGSCGKLYRHKITDYAALGSWCQTRQGQVIVCEREGADWLPFKEFATIKSAGGSRGKGYSKEVIWINSGSS